MIQNLSFCEQMVLKLVARHGRVAAIDNVEAAKVLGIGTTKLNELLNYPKGDPRRVNRTSYGKILFAELVRHSAAELEMVA